MNFNGPVYVPKIDSARLSIQYKRIFDLMEDAIWRTLGEIADATGDPQASISAQLRHMRKERFGGHKINKARVALDSGLWVYQLVVNRGATS